VNFAGFGRHPPAPEDLSDAPSAIASPADDLLDRYLLLGERHYGGVCLLPAKKPFILKPLGAGEQG
jgi:hypothetical protein